MKHDKERTKMRVRRKQRSTYIQSRAQQRQHQETALSSIGLAHHIGVRVKSVSLVSLFVFMYIPILFHVKSTLTLTCYLLMLVSFFILFANECGGGSLGYYKKIKPLIDCGDVRCLPALIEACDFYWAQRNREIEAAMTKLLNTVSSKDAGLLSVAQQNKLWHLAVKLWRENEYLHEEFALAAIRALTQVGNAAMLPKFRQLANRNVLYDKQRFLIEVAGEHLPLLEARLQAQNVPETLLRSYLPSNTRDELLRPGSGTRKNFPDVSTQLLRSTPGQSNAPDAPKE